MRIRNIVVPLDGSRLAEAAIPYATRLAEDGDATLTLVHVLEQRPPASVHGERHLANPAEASLYLDALRTSLGCTALEIRTHVHENAVRDVARSLSEHAIEFHADLIVMTTHGSGGMKRWVFGSIAQQVIARSSCPVLFVPCDPAPRSVAPDVRHVVVPLDGDPSHEQAIPLACALANVFGSAVQLLTVVPTIADLGGSRSAVARMLPGTATTELDLEAEAAVEYLKSVRAARCDMLAPIGANPDLVERGDPAKVITRLAERTDRALVVMATHRKVGAAAFWAGSVAPRVAADVQCPVALVSMTNGS
ncbi:MAG: universal stress protein [Phycisphaerales bacterium]|nr:universal stress protein [Phycisphaerales bacterium]